jgi:hypothetical protein
MNNENIDQRLLEIIKSITKLESQRLNSVSIIAYYGYINFSLNRAYVLNESNQVSIGLNATVRITLIENYWDDFAVELGIFQPTLEHIFITENLRKLEGPETFIFGSPHYLKEGVHYKNIEERKNKFSYFTLSTEGFRQIEEKYRWIYHDLFLPKLKETLDIKFLDSTINDKVKYLGGSSDDYFLALGGMQFRRMALAKLSGNPLYEDICDWNREVCKKIEAIPYENQNAFQKNFKKVFETVYERLKSVEPLKNSKLPLDLV